MTTIYFDQNKQAYAYAIENPLCTTTSDIWAEFCMLQEGYDYLITANGIEDLRETAEYKQAQAQKERERLNGLSLTAADVERAIYKAKGMDFEDVLALVEAANEAAAISEDSTTSAIDIKALKIELKANNFYRGNPYIDAVGAILGYTSDEIDYLFKNKELPEQV